MSKTRTWSLIDRATDAFAGAGPSAVELGDALLDEAALLDPKQVSGITLTVTFDYDDGKFTGVMYVDR